MALFIFVVGLAIGALWGYMSASEDCRAGVTEVISVLDMKGVVIQVNETKLAQVVIAQLAEAREQAEKLDEDFSPQFT